MPTGAKSMPGALSKEVGDILRAQIARKNLSQVAVAEAVHLSQPQLSSLLNAKKHIDVEKLDEICWAIGLDFKSVVKEADHATQDRQIRPGWTIKSLVR